MPVRFAIVQEWRAAGQQCVRLPGFGQIARRTTALPALDVLDLAFVGPPPSQAVAPGLYLFRVAIEGPAGDRSLVASWQQLQPDMSDYDAPRATAQRIVLAAGLDDGALSYFGYPARDADPVWQDRWIDRTEMPMLVRIDLRCHRDDRRQWPSLVVAPQIRGTP